MKMATAWMLCKRIALATALTVGAAGAAQADPWMMGGGPGGYHHGYGMGPGMMGGYGMGPGMMGGYGMGPGMMGGYGGCPMMGIGPLWELNLTPDQKKKIDGIISQQREQHWSIMRAISDDQAKLRSLYSADPLDANAIGKVYDDIHKNQRAMLDSAIRNRNQIYALLTPEQKKQLRQSWGGG